MGLIQVCVLTFCADLFGHFEYDTYPYELKFETLTLESNLTLHNITYLKDALELRLKLQVEKEIHDMLSVKIHMTLDKLSALADSAKREELDIRTCFASQKEQVRTAFQDEVGEIEPCITDIEPVYNHLSAEIEELQEDAEALLKEIVATSNKCKEEPIGQLLMCLAYEFKQLEKKQQTLQYAYNKLNEQYQDALTLVPPLVECIKGTEKGIIRNLYQVLVGARDCYAALEEEVEQARAIEEGNNET